MILDPQQRAEVLALIRRHAVPLVCRPAESPKEVTPLSRRGIRKRRHSYGIDTTISGHRVVLGGFKTAALAAEQLYRMRTNPTVLEDYLMGRLSPRKWTAQQAMDSYMECRGSYVKSADRHRQFMAHLTPVLGAVQASAIRQKHVDRYMNHRKAEGASPKTAYNEVCFLRTCLLYGWRNDEVRERPKFKLSNPGRPRTRVAREDEVRRLYAGADVPLQRVILAAWSLGLRRSEMVAARWSWVNELAREMTVPADLAKNGEARTVQLQPGLWDLLHLEPRHPEVLFCRVRKGRNGKGKHEPTAWTKTTLRRAWLALCAAEGVEDLRLHDLRRSMSTVAQERGHAPSAVQKVGGWLDAGVMQRHYSHARTPAQARVSEDLESMILKTRPDELAGFRET